MGSKSVDQHFTAASACRALVSQVVSAPTGTSTRQPLGNVTLFTFLADRYQQQRTLMLTSNLVFSEWDRIFKNPMTAMAAVDRLVHRAVILEFVRETSLRETEAKGRNL